MKLSESQKKLIDIEISRHNSVWPKYCVVILACERNDDGSVDLSSVIEITESDFLARVAEVSDARRQTNHLQA